jgi:hypothetical protein
MVGIHAMAITFTTITFRHELKEINDLFQLSKVNWTHMEEILAYRNPEAEGCGSVVNDVVVFE